MSLCIYRKCPYYVCKSLKSSMNYDIKLLQNNEYHHTLFKYVISTKYEFQISI